VLVSLLACRSPAPVPPVPQQPDSWFPPAPGFEVDSQVLALGDDLLLVITGTQVQTLEFSTRTWRRGQPLDTPVAPVRIAHPGGAPVLVGRTGESVRRASLGWIEHPPAPDGSTLLDASEAGIFASSPEGALWVWSWRGEPGWREVALPVALTAATAAAAGPRALALWNPDGSGAVVWARDPGRGRDHLDVKLFPAGGPSPRTGAAVGWSTSGFVVFGGVRPDGAPATDGAQWDERSGAWSPLPALAGCEGRVLVGEGPIVACAGGRLVAARWAGEAWDVVGSEYQRVVQAPDRRSFLLWKPGEVRVLTATEVTRPFWVDDGFVPSLWTGSWNVEIVPVEGADGRVVAWSLPWW
jgi:hypothetical protein